MRLSLSTLQQRFPEATTYVDSQKGRRFPSLYPALFAVLLALASAFPAMAQKESYEPAVGQEGKDVIWVPTPQPLVEKMLDIAKVTPQDYLIDLGSGDGRTVITAARRGLKAHGIEYNPDMAELARKNAAAAGVAQRATFATADLFETDLSKAHVITMFLLPTINERLRPRLLELRPGTRIVSNSFTMGNWEPDDTAYLRDGCDHWCTALLWIVPAKVEGSWRLGGQELKLTQNFQKLSGTLGSQAISEARLAGNDISFTVNGARYTGTVNGKLMKGNMHGQSGGNWIASRA